MQEDQEQTRIVSQQGQSIGFTYREGCAANLFEDLPIFIFFWERAS